MVSWDLDVTQAMLGALEAVVAETKAEVNAAMPATVAALTALIVSLPTEPGDPGSLYVDPNSGAVTVAS